MGIKMGYINAKRELFFKGTSGKRYVIELMTGKDIHSSLKKKDIKNYKIDCQAPMLFSSDILLNDSCKEEFFFVHPEKVNVITRYENYDDLWFTSSIGRIKKRTYPLVEKCLKILYKSGFTEENLVYFIKQEDGFYHLMVDGDEFGYLDDSNSDADFKNMLSYVFKDVGYSIDVVVLPSKGENLIFSSTVGLYKKKEDFEKACKSKGVFKSSLNIHEKGIEELVAVDSV